MKMMVIAFITFNSSLVPLTEGLCSSNPGEFESLGFRRNRTHEGLTVPRSDQLSQAFTWGPNKMRRKQDFFDGKKYAAGKSYEIKCATGKIFFTESWWAICPVDVVCNSLFTNLPSLVVLVVSLEMLRPAVMMLMSVWPPRALLRVELPSLWQVPLLLPRIEVLWRLLPDMVLSALLMTVRASATGLLSLSSKSVWCPVSSLWVPAGFPRSLWWLKGGTHTIVEDVGSVLYLQTQSDAYMRDDGLQVMGPGPLDFVSSSPVDVAPVSWKCPRVLFVQLKIAARRGK